MTSTDAFQLSWCPTDFGWNREDERYKIEWFKGDVAPKCLDIVCSDEDMEIGEGLCFFFFILCF